jgi:hypothetical protein
LYTYIYIYYDMCQQQELCAESGVPLKALVLLAWFLEVFIAGQAILSGVEPSMAERAAIFACRIFIYLGSMCRILYCGLPGPGLARKKECGKLWKVIYHCGLSKHRAERRSSPKRKNAKQFLIVSGLPCMLTGVAEARSSCYTMTSRMEELSGPTKSRCPSALLYINTLNTLISCTRASDNEDFGLWNCVGSISPRG